MSLSVKATGLSKKYMIRRATGTRYNTLRESLAHGAKDIGRTLLRGLGKSSPPNKSMEEFWALRDLEFEIKAGERVGIVGHNGAGKSTLLKILSRITEPTVGRIELHGRAASLLEVGTGFHPELTGRENIFLNGAILGMSRAEIARKFDAIVDFAEVEKFLDTPVKRYSSGMYVRLAFAVAAFLEPDILIVDEVLAVGDARFQKKSLDKMGEAQRDGRTVLFVSHNMAAMQRLCTRAILLQQGRIVKDAGAEEVVVDYLAQTAAEHGQASADTAGLADDSAGVAEFLGWSIRHSSAGPYSLTSGLDLVLDISLRFSRDLEDCAFGMAIWNEAGVLVWSGLTYDLVDFAADFAAGDHAIRFAIPGFALKAGRYRIEMSLDTRHQRAGHWHLNPELHILPHRATGTVPEWQGLAAFDFSVIRLGGASPASAYPTTPQTGHATTAST